MQAAATALPTDRTAFQRGSIFPLLHCRKRRFYLRRWQSCLRSREIHSTAHDGGYITAQAKHYLEEDSGFVLNQCKLTADPGVTKPVYLGGPGVPMPRLFSLIRRWAATSIGRLARVHPGETHSIETVFYADTTPRPRRAARPARSAYSFSNSRTGQQFAPSVFLRGADNWDLCTHQTVAGNLRCLRSYTLRES